MTMKILTPQGDEAPHVPTEAKRAHDPEEVKKHQRNLMLLFNELMQGFVQEMMPKEGRPRVIELDFDKVRDHYSQRWSEQARVLNASGFPHQVDEQAIAKEIDKLWAQQEHERLMTTPLELVPDLGKHELLPVCMIKTGMLHLSDVCAVSVHPGGLCRVWVRKPHETLEQWVRGWNEPTREPDVECVQYTLNELHGLLTACRIARIATLSEELMDTARRSTR